MVTYAQETDPNKAKISSIWKANEPTPVATENKAPDFIWTPVAKVATEQAPQQNTQLEQANYGTILDKSQSVSSKSWSYYNDVYLPKKQAEQQAKQGQYQNIEQPAPSKAQTMDTETLAQSYELGDVSAIDLENLRQTDPLKYEETKLAIERKRTLDLINQTGQDYIETYKALSESYLGKWDEISASDEGKTLREEVFAKYWLNESNDKILKYANQIDDLDTQLQAVSDSTGTGDALADRGEMIRMTKMLTQQRNDLSKLRANEVDYYRLGLEQADAVVNDYKEYKAQEIAQLGVKFQMMTGMSQMEFEQRDQQARDYLTEIDRQEWILKEDIAEKKANDLETKKQAQDTVLNAWMLSLYDNFSDEEKSVLLQLPSEAVWTLLKTVDAQAKADAEKSLNLEKMNWEKYKFNVEQKSKQSSYKPTNIKVDWKDVTVLVNEQWDIKPMNTQYLSWETPVVRESGTLWWQCWAYVNRAIPWMSPNWKRFWDTLSEKVDLIDSSVPVVWWAVVMDYWQIDSKSWKNYWHVWVVTGINEDWTINVSDSNVNLDEKVSNRTLSKSEMNKVVWYMMPPVPKQSIIDGVSSFKFWLTKEESWVFEETIGNLIEDWDVNSIKVNLRDAYMTKLTAWEQEKIRSRYIVADMTQTLLQNIENYVDQGGDTGIFTGSKEQMLNKIGKTSNKEVASLQTQIVDLIDKISRDRSGAALTEEEIQLYTSILPWVWKSMEYNRWVVEWLLQSVKNQDKYIDQEVSKRVTGKAKDFVYPPERSQKDFASWLQSWSAVLVD